MLAILLPRLLRPAQAAAYLGVGATIFERDVRPYLIEIPMGAGGVAFDRLDLDAWADEHKARTGRPAEKGAQTMGRSRTSGIVTDAGGNRIINKVHQGMRIYARLGKVTVAAAENDLRRRIAEVEEEAKRGSAARRTFGKACVRYLSEKAAKRSIDTDAYHIGLVEPWLGSLELVAIHNDTPELVAFKTHRLEVDKVCGTTVKRTLEVVRHILNLAARKWRTEDNQPWLPIAPPLLEMPKNPHARAPYPLAWDEQRLLFSWLPKHLAEMALFKVNTGTRESEVCGMQWAWEQRVPELSTSVFVIPGGYVKNTDDRLVVLNETARAVIEARRGQTSDARIRDGR